jgi:hypothetical protein
MQTLFFYSCSEAVLLLSSCSEAVLPLASFYKSNLIPCANGKLVV